MTPEQHAAKIRQLEAPMAAAYLAEVRAVESEATVAEVERLLREGDEDSLVAYLFLSLGLFIELSRSAFIMGANNEAAGRFRFDSNTWAVINLLREEAEGIRYGVDSDLRKSIGVIRQNGRTFHNQALDILGVRSGYTGVRSGGVLGLTGQMTEWVETARSQLLSNNPANLRAYLRRKERDTAFDSVVKAMLSKQEEAIKKARVSAAKPITPSRPAPAMPPLPEVPSTPSGASRPSIAPPVPEVPGSPSPPNFSEKDADKIAKGYASKLSKANADRVAKQAASSAYNAGRNQSIQQMIEKGLITAGDVTKRWKTMRDERVRHSHATMNNQRVSFNEPFVSGLGGLMMYPSDQSMGASDADIYGCRCVAEYVIKKRF